jgi:uncharacterized membrane protein YccC
MDNSAVQDLRALLSRTARDFAPWPLGGERLVDEIACLASVLLAIGSAHLLGIRNVGWAAFSAYMVIRASFSESLWRGSLRVLGTGLGAALAWLLAPALLQSTVLLSAALALAGAVTLYLALLDRRGYGWLLAGLTFAMVLIDGMEQPGEALDALARLRFIDVCVGTAASLLVSAGATLLLKRQAPACRHPLHGFQVWHQDALRHALQGGIALALIPWVWRAFHIKALSQSSITIMAVMMVPLADLGTSAHPAPARLRHRFAGCCIGGLLATGMLIIAHDSVLIMTLAVCAGIMAGRHIENGQLGIGYAGTQFALAFLVVLVPDSYAGHDVAPAIERLSGILLGTLLLEPVRWLFIKLCGPAAVL